MCAKIIHYSLPCYNNSVDNVIARNCAGRYFISNRNDHLATDIIVYFGATFKYLSNNSKLRIFPWKIFPVFPERKKWSGWNKVKRWHPTLFAFNFLISYVLYVWYMPLALPLSMAIYGQCVGRHRHRPHPRPPLCICFSPCDETTFKQFICSE